MPFRNIARILVFVGAWSLTAMPASAEAASVYPELSSPYLSGDSREGSGISIAFIPAYQAIESLADGFYNTLRWNLFDAVLPTGLNRGMVQPPKINSADIMYRRLRERELDATEGLRAALAGYEPDWRTAGATAARIETQALTQAFRDTLLDRYELTQYVKNRDLLDPGVLGGAVIAGAVAAYFYGTNANATLGPLSFGFSLPSGDKLRESLGEGRAVHSTGSLELAARRYGLRLTLDLGLRARTLSQERIALNYHLTY